MAYDLQNYRPASQNSVVGLSSSHSYLDGVPFKISAAFRPPAQPSLPPELLEAATFCDALHEEYHYDTEEAVLAWARAREEAKAKAVAEREAAEKAKVAERARVAVTAAESHSSSESEEDLPDASKPSTSASDVVEAPQPLPQVKPPWQLPMATLDSNSILTPTPIQSTKKKVQSPMDARTTVDLALFEQEGDPFDNMELQTLNDMEELRTLLGGTSVEGGSQGPSPNPDNQAVKGGGEAQNGHCSGLGQEAVSSSSAISSTNNLYENVTTGPSGKMECDRQVNGSNKTSVSRIPATATDPSTNVDFSTKADSSSESVSIRPDYSQQTVHFQTDSVPIYSNISSKPDSSLGCELPEKYSNSKVFKPVLPPIRARGKSLGSEAMLDSTSGNMFSTAFNPATQSSLPQANNRVGIPAGEMPPNPYTMLASSAGSSSTALDQPHIYSNLPSSKPTTAAVGAHPALGSMYSRHRNAGTESPVNGVCASAGSLRNSKSNPDLSATGSRPGSARSTPQPWNPYKPLPPTPVSDLRSSSSSTESLSTDQCQTLPSRTPPSTTTSGGVAMSAAQPDHDPYHSLSNEAKNFVNNLTSMGFSRSRASRAVEKFGADEREVVDHLVNVDKLVEKKFAPALAETGLQLFRNNLQKAEQFLDLYQQFMELGFTGDRIQAALVKHELDRDKALDYLTT